MLSSGFLKIFTTICFGVNGGIFPVEGNDCIVLNRLSCQSRFNHLFKLVVLVYTIEWNNQVKNQVGVCFAGNHPKIVHM